MSKTDFYDALEGEDIERFVKIRDKTLKSDTTQ
jgi:hypothetical protein